MTRVSTRRAVLAGLVWTVGPASVVALARAGRIGAAGLVLLLIVLHAAAEVIAWEVRDLRATRRRRQALRRASDPLANRRFYDDLERWSHRMDGGTRGAA